MEQFQVGDTDLLALFGINHKSVRFIHARPRQARRLGAYRHLTVTDRSMITSTASDTTVQGQTTAHTAEKNATCGDAAHRVQGAHAESLGLNQPAQARQTPHLPLAANPSPAHPRKEEQETATMSVQPGSETHVHSTHPPSR